jgi:ribosomal protein S18 acetylase RimI-like enzyme
MNKNNYIARNVEMADWQKYKKIRLEALKNDQRAFSSSYEQELKRTDEDWQGKIASSLPGNDKKIFIGVEKNENEFLAIGGAFAKDDPSEWNIFGIYVTPEYRGQGISKILFAGIITALKNLGGIKKLVLRVNAKQEAAIRLYKSFGFEIVETIKDQAMGDGNFYDEYEMISNF